MTSWKGHLPTVLTESASVNVEYLFLLVSLPARSEVEA